MAVETMDVLGTFPVTQQLVGAFFMGYGCVCAIISLAKIVFHEFQKFLEIVRPVPDQSKINSLKDLISAYRKEEKHAVENLVLGFITAVPVLGSFIWGVQWLRHANGLS